MHLFTSIIYLLIFIYPTIFIVSLYSVLIVSSWRKLRNFNFLFFITTIIAIFLKLFLIQVTFSDEPTTMLILKKAPSFQSYARANELIHGDTTDEIYENYAVITADENRYIGENTYDLIVNYTWLGIPLILLTVNFYFAIKKVIFKSEYSKKQKNMRLILNCMFTITITFWFLFVTRINDYPYRSLYQLRSFHYIWPMIMIGNVIFALKEITTARHNNSLVIFILVSVLSLAGIAVLCYYGTIRFIM